MTAIIFRFGTGGSAGLWPRCLGALSRLQIKIQVLDVKHTICSDVLGHWELWGTESSGVQFNRHLEFKALVKAQLKAGVKDAFRKAPDKVTVKAWVMVRVKALQNVY